MEAFCYLELIADGRSLHDLEEVEHSSYTLLLRLPTVAATCFGFVSIAGHVRCVKANGRAYAAILKDGTVRSFGSALYGGDSSGVQPLRDVVQLQSTACAFAALRSDGHVVTWGHKAWGGDSEAVGDQLRLGIALRWRPGYTVSIKVYKG